jgi:hypothetical protein
MLRLLEKECDRPGSVAETASSVDVLVTKVKMFSRTAWKAFLMFWKKPNLVCLLSIAASFAR